MFANVETSRPPLATDDVPVRLMSTSPRNATRSGCVELAPWVGVLTKGLQMRHFRRRVSDGTRTRDRLDHKQGLGSTQFGAQSRLGSGIHVNWSRSAFVHIPFDTGRCPAVRTQLT
jgi:hypothetical protein